MAGRPRYINTSPEPDPRFQVFMRNLVGEVFPTNQTTEKTKIKNLNNFAKLRNNVFQGINGNIRQSIQISSGVLDVTQDASGDSVLVRSLIVVDPESAASEDTLDLIEMDGNELEGARLTLMGIVSKQVIISHLATASGTKKNITCPGNVDYILDGEDVVDLIYDKTSETWLIVNSTTYSSLEVRTKENTIASMNLFRDDSSPNDSDVVGKLLFYGNDSAGNKTEYGNVTVQSLDVTNGTEDGMMLFTVMEAGSTQSPLYLDGESKLLGIRDGYDFFVGTSTGTKIGTSSSQKLGFFGVTPVTQRAAYTVTNHVTDRSYDANSTTLAEIADVLGTLIVDLRSLGLIQ